MASSTAVAGVSLPAAGSLWIITATSKAVSETASLRIPLLHMAVSMFSRSEEHKTHFMALKGFGSVERN
jgi:hypothetical protein